MMRLLSSLVLGSIILLTACKVESPVDSKNLLLNFDFEEQSDSPFSDKPSIKLIYGTGIDGRSLDIAMSNLIPGLRDTDTSWFSNNKDFSVSIWVKALKKSLDTTIIISNSDFRKEDAGIYGKRRTNNGFTVISGHHHRFARIEPAEGKNQFPILIVGKDMILKTDVSGKDLLFSVKDKNDNVVDAFAIDPK